MTIKQFIEKAIEGGWKHKHYDVKRTLDSKVFSKDVIADIIEHYKLEILFDPRAWEAVGKVEGWESYWCVYCNQQFSSKEEAVDTLSTNDRCNHQELEDEAPKYKNAMHAMIDALCEGKSLEEYIATL